MILALMEPPVTINVKIYFFLQEGTYLYGHLILLNIRILNSMYPNFYYFKPSLNNQFATKTVHRSKIPYI